MSNCVFVLEYFDLTLIISCIQNWSEMNCCNYDDLTSDSMAKSNFMHQIYIAIVLAYVQVDKVVSL